MSVREFSLPDVVSPHNGEFYIGLVMDVVVRYLAGSDAGLRYYVEGGLTNQDYRAVRTTLNGNDIRVGIVERDKYFVSGFPETEDFSAFEREAPHILEQMASVNSERTNTYAVIT